MRYFALLVCVCFLADGAFADNWNFTVKKEAGTVKIVTNDLVTPADNSFLGDQDVDVKIECKDNIDCTKMEIKIVNGTTTRTHTFTGSAASVTGKIPATDLPAGTNTVTVTHKGTPPEADTAVPFTVKRVAANQPNPASPSNPSTPVERIPVPLQELLRAPCVRPQLTGATYDEQNNLATFAIDALGNVLDAPDETVDENDRVRILLIAPPGAIDLLNVKRRSATRTLGTLNIVGSGLVVTIPSNERPQQNTGPGTPPPPPPPPCSQREYVLTDFAPGNGVIELSAFVDEQRAVVNTVEFAVSRLYDGIFGLGVITSDLTDRTFTLVPHEDDQVIAEEQEGETTRYVVTYTPYVWGKRDLDKRRGWREELRQRWWHHINPIVGITLDDVGENAIVGASLDVGPFLVSYGWHFSNVHVLSSRSGLKPGDTFTGAAGDLPVVTRWENDAFVGFSIDLRAAVQLFSTLGSAAAP